MRLAAILQALVALRRSLSTGLPILQFLAEIAYYTIQDTLFVFFFFFVNMTKIDLEKYTKKERTMWKTE